MLSSRLAFDREVERFKEKDEEMSRNERGKPQKAKEKVLFPAVFPSRDIVRRTWKAGKSAFWLFFLRFPCIFPFFLFREGAFLCLSLYENRSN